MLSSLDPDESTQCHCDLLLWMLTSVSLRERRALGSFTVKSSLVGQIFLPPVLQKSNNAKPGGKGGPSLPLGGKTVSSGH